MLTIVEVQQVAGDDGLEGPDLIRQVLQADALRGGPTTKIPSDHVRDHGYVLISFSQ